MTTEYRLVLERVASRNDSGFPNTVTMFEMTDTAEALRDTWLPALSARLGGDASPAATPDASGSPAPTTATSVRKPRKRAEPAQQPAQPGAEAPAATTPTPATPEPAAQQPVTAPPPAAVPAETPRINPFARPPA